jgi:hypothetical protein
VHWTHVEAVPQTLRVAWHAETGFVVAEVTENKQNMSEIQVVTVVSMKIKAFWDIILPVLKM